MLSESGLVKPGISYENLLDAARKKTGLEDFGDPAFQEGLQKLISSLKEEAELSQVGRIVAYFNLLDYLTVRLQLVAYRAEHPQVAQQKINRPLFILGLPRTGTTILYELIAQDPAFRSPASWEVAKPMPPANQASYANDSRIRSVDMQLAISEKLSPGFKSIHAVGAKLPQECVYLFSSNFVSEQYGYMYNIPAYRRWALQHDMTATYQWHAHFLQHMQSGFCSERWVLKTPSHLAYLTYLIAQYPDADIVWTHREPVQAVASFASLVSTLQGGFSDSVERKVVGEHEARHSAKLLQLGVQQRAALGDSHFFDVRFADICTDPISVVQQIYERFGIAMSADALRRMREYTQKRPRDLYGKHVYTAKEFGVESPRGEPGYTQYLDHYGQFCQ